MEIEYKWAASPAQLEALAAVNVKARHTIQMQAIYYETPDGYLRKSGAALRVRRENDRVVCCLKMDKVLQGGCTMRREFETDAADLTDGLRRLPKQGAPADLCETLLRADLRELARTEFTREALLLEYMTEKDICTAELALDRGALGGNGHMQPFTEAELEYKSGSEAAFHRYAEVLMQQFSLTAESRSKLARAIAIANQAE